MANVISTIWSIGRLVREEGRQSRIARMLYGTGEKRKLQMTELVRTNLEDTEVGLTIAEIAERLKLSAASRHVYQVVLSMEECGQILYHEDLGTFTLTDLKSPSLPN